MRAIRWGVVTETSPLAVRFAGDGVDVPIEIKNADYTPTLSDKVLLADTGGGWVIVCELGST